MANSSYNTVQIAVTSPSKHIEGDVVAASIYPGFLVERVTEFTFRPCQITDDFVHSFVATENIYQGYTFTGNIGTDDFYAVGEHMYLRYARAGDIFWMVAGDVIAGGDLVASFGATQPGKIHKSPGTPVAHVAIGCAMDSGVLNDYVRVEMY